MHTLKTVMRTIAAALTALLINHGVAAEAFVDWPNKVVTMEELRPLTSFSMKVPGVVAKGRVRGPSVLRVHVDSAGKVARIALLESCGNGELDESAMHAMRGMKFAQYTVGQVPTEVSLVVPIHVPKNLGRSL